MSISEKMLEDLRVIFAQEKILVADIDMNEAGLAVASFVLIRQMKELESFTRHA